MPHHHHQPPQWLENEEKERTLKYIGERLVKIGQLLLDKGQFKLGRSLVKPSDPCLFIMRYERMPRGELNLKFELIWEPNFETSGARSNEDELLIE